MATQRDANVNFDQTAEFEEWLYSDESRAMWHCFSAEYNAAAKAWEARLQTRHEVMNPPASAARGAEARNLTSANVMGLGEVHRASEARPADDVPAPCPPPTTVPEQS